MHRDAWLALALVVGVGAASVVPAGCSQSAAPAAQGPTGTRDELLDPKTCGKCHTYHYSDWSLSMHAYAADDPVFLAMNARGQRETSGKLGTFCVKCHAPMAVRDGKTQDGLNLASVDPKYKGITCFFCHTVESVDGAHDAPLNLSTDLAMRGELSDPPPVANTSHASVYSELHDQSRLASAQLCGPCHDIVTPQGAALERTYFEWAHSAYNTAGSAGQTCGTCHMKQGGVKQVIAPAVPGLQARYSHDHHFPAVDVALGPGAANAAIQKTLVQEALDETSIIGALCVTSLGGIRVLLDPLGLGHQWPSGAAQDRRAWAEVIAYRGGSVVYQSGVVPDGAAVTGLQNDPDLWLLRDRMFDAQCAPVSMFWQAAKTSGNELPALATFDAGDPAFYRTHAVKFFPQDGSPLPSGAPDRVTLRIRLQPVGLDVLDDLVQSGDLDPSIAPTMPTFDVSIMGPGGPRQIEWTPEAASGDAGLQKFLDPFDKTTVTCVGASTFNSAVPPAPAPTMPPCTP